MAPSIPGEEKERALVSSSSYKNINPVMRVILS
jgi:hypothetical protein